MSSFMALIADAVTTRLNNQTFSQPFTATRTYRPKFSKEDLKSLRVVVSPREIEVNPSTRGAHQHDYAIDVAVMKKVKPDDNAEIDPLMLLSQEILDDLRLNPLSVPGSGSFRVQEATNPLAISGDQLNEEHVFQSVARVVYRVVR